MKRLRSEAWSETSGAERWSSCVSASVDSWGDGAGTVQLVELDGAGEPRVETALYFGVSELLELAQAVAARHAEQLEQLRAGAYGGAL